MEHPDFSPSSGSFRCRRAGAFAFALSSLLKSEENQEVTVKMVKRRASGEEEVRIRETACLYLACSNSFCSSCRYYFWCRRR